MIEHEEMHFGKSLCVKIVFFELQPGMWKMNLGFGFGCYLLGL